MAGAGGAAAVPSLLLLLTAFGVAASSVAAATGMARSGCTRSCGNISIPYPFGIEPGCYHAAGFNLTCNQLENPPKLFLGDGTVQVIEISVPKGTVRINSSSVNLTFDGRHATMRRTWGSGLPRYGPYFLSDMINRLLVVGCGVQVDLGVGHGNIMLGSCTAVCPSTMQGLSRPNDTMYEPYPWSFSGNCSGIGCCETDIALSYSAYHLHRSLYGNQDFNPEVSVYVTDAVFNANEVMYTQKAREALTATLKWVIDVSTCPANATAPECRSANSACRHSISNSGIQYLGRVCSCSDGYHGNPYIPGGCKDINECKYSASIYPCYGDCTNTPGSYICRCPNGYRGNASLQNGCKDIDECELPEMCYGTCLNFPGTFQCQCPNGTYGNPLIKGGCITMNNSIKGLTIGLGIGGGAGLLVVALAPFIRRKIKIQNMKKNERDVFQSKSWVIIETVDITKCKHQ
ncbi:unnamed protein product [Urochloa humidicola]